MNLKPCLLGLVLCLQFIARERALADQEMTLAPSDEVLQEIYREAVVAESLGQIDDARTRWTSIVRSAGVDSRYRAMSQRKLCSYTLSFCDSKKVSQVTKNSGGDGSADDLQTMSGQVAALLETIDGIEIKIVNRKVVIDGLVIAPSEKDRIAQVSAIFDQGKIVNLVKLSPLYQKLLAGAIANDINEPSITARAVNGQMILEGTAASSGERTRAEQIASSYGTRVPASETIAGEDRRSAPTVLNLISAASRMKSGPAK